ncbi:MAG TPA: DUF2844 domain-containing protein [Candidatus Acidoferrales bacterium]|nr:DUF2844 domain-containing protein [Candidatus Acidoferrales bacterium]
MKTTLGLLIAFLLGTLPASAGLGQTMGSVRIDQAAMRGKLAATTQQGYSVQQITAPDGAVVKEYVSPAGVVFGVSWHGPTMPNLALLLGPYFPQFQKAAQSARRRRGPLLVRTNQLVVESGGHLRSFRGRAYVPALVPDSVTQAVVQ